MNSKLFNKMRWMAEIGFPALSVLATAIGTIWGLPVMIPVVATLVAVNAFVGALVGVSRAEYNK